MRLYGSHAILASLLILALLWTAATPAPVAGQSTPPAEPELFLPYPAFRSDIVTHVVQEGDTVWDLGIHYGISPQTIIWANGWLEKNPHFILPGQELIIPPVTGVLHYVREGETLEELSERYGVAVADVVTFHWNGLESAEVQLQVDQALIFPGGRKPGLDPLAGLPPPPRIPISINWPVRAGITRGFLDWHRGLDIGAAAGSPVKAAAAGRVTYAGWSNIGYGNVIFVDHGHDVMTVYAHLSAIGVSTGDTVAAGQNIGAVGSTGRSTGPHLHFEVRVYGRSRSPLAYLP